MVSGPSDNIRNGHLVSQCQGMSPPASNIMCSHQISVDRKSIYYISNVECMRQRSAPLDWVSVVDTNACGKMRFIAAVISSRHVVSWHPDSRCRLVPLDTLNNSWSYTLCCDNDIIWFILTIHLHCTLMYELILNASEYYNCCSFIITNRNTWFFVRFKMTSNCRAW